MKIVGVKINDFGKILYYDSNELNLKVNLTVIVKDDKGLQFAKVVSIVDADNNNDYDKVIRIATKRDYQKYLSNLEDAKLAYKKCGIIFLRTEKPI